MTPLPPIPTPPSFYWREFRIQVLPVVVFTVTAGAVVLLWRQAGLNAGLPAVGEGVRSVVSSPQLGLLQELKVQPYQMVEAGEPVAVIAPRDPRAQLDLFQAEVQLARLRLQPSVAEGNAMNFEQIRVELLRTRSELAMAKVNLERAENDVRRNAPLFRDKLVSEEIYDLSAKSRDLYRAEIAEKTKAISEIERRLEELRTLGEPSRTGLNEPLRLVMNQLEGMKSATATNWAPVTLVAPIRGMVQIVYRQPGENVAEGEPILTINSPRSDRIVGYLRQPFPIQPEPGMKVSVRTRDRLPKQFQSTITQIGAQVETITNVLALVRQGTLLDAGLPIVVAVPPGVMIRPGEMVDVLIRPDYSWERASSTDRAQRKEIQQ